ncbi:unnamed protein product [Rotaria sordida]|uniref:C-type lectin domain-containing protein n=1 Tax=Rotaria sordida TaxID=392033 RepID=A0A818RQP3_9BILA|nr:unnamed protein product [Rotaria sordida]
MSSYWTSSARKRIPFSTSSVYDDLPDAYDVVIIFHSAEDLPKMNIVRYANPYFVAKIDHQISFTIYDKDDEKIIGNYIGEFEVLNIINYQAPSDGHIIVSSSGQDNGRFHLSIHSKKSSNESQQLPRYTFDGPCRYSRHDSLAVDRFAMSNTDCIHSTWTIQLRRISFFFPSDERQQWNRQYKSAQDIFDKETQQIKPRLYNYIIDDDTWQFIETSIRFSTDSTIVWCFNEPCIDDSLCSKQNLQCHFGHCLCPLDQFWAGYIKHCIPCPTGWINLIVFCIYYEHQMMDWLSAQTTCRHMIDSTNETSRLLEINNLDEYYYIQKYIKQILTDDQMKTEVNSSKGILSSTIAFIGSLGLRSSPTKWIYHWGNNSSKTYESTSPMWCKEKHWDLILYPAEPAWEQHETINRTFQALKRWDDSSDTCLVSLLSTNIEPFLCESGRLNNQSIIFISSTIISIISSTTRKQTIISNQSSLSTSQQLLTSFSSRTTSSKLNLTNGESVLKNKRFLFIIIGIIGIVMQKKKKSSKDLKSIEKKSLSSSKINKKHMEDLQSNDSFDSNLTAESTAQKTLKSKR